MKKRIWTYILNKLAWLVISVLILLGAAMWYLANVSFQDYFKQHLIARTSEYLDSDLDIKAIDAQSNYLGHISDLTFTDSQSQTVWLKVGAIEYQLNKKSFKKPPVIIENIHFSGADLKSKNLATVKLEKLKNAPHHLGTNMEIATISYATLDNPDEIVKLEFAPNHIKETETEDIWQQALAKLIQSLVE